MSGAHSHLMVTRQEHKHCNTCCLQKYSDFLQLMINAEKEAHSATEDSHGNGTLHEAEGETNGYWTDKRKGKGKFHYSCVFFLIDYCVLQNPFLHHSCTVSVKMNRFFLLGQFLGNHGRLTNIVSFLTVNLYSIPYYSLLANA